MESYISSGTAVEMFEDGALLGVFVLTSLAADTIELMNIAVHSDYRGKGFGKILLAEAVRRARVLGANRIEVGTGNSSIDQLAFYQKAGFRITGVDHDFFVRNYPEPLEENGIPCRDMVRLTFAFD